MYVMMNGTCRMYAFEFPVQLIFVLHLYNFIRNLIVQKWTFKLLILLFYFFHLDMNLVSLYTKYLCKFNYSSPWAYQHEFEILFSFSHISTLILLCNLLKWQIIVHVSWNKFVCTCMMLWWPIYDCHTPGFGPLLGHVAKQLFIAEVQFCFYWFYWVMKFICRKKAQTINYCKP